MVSIGIMFSKWKAAVNGYSQILVLFDGFDKLLTQMDGLCV